MIVPVIPQTTRAMGNKRIVRKKFQACVCLRMEVTLKSPSNKAKRHNKRWENHRVWLQKWCRKEHKKYPKNFKIIKAYSNIKDPYRDSLLSIHDSLIH